MSILSLEASILAQQDPNQIKLPAWLQIPLQLVPLATLFLGLPIVSRLGKNSGAENRKAALDIRRAELENQKLEIELRKLEGEPDDSGRQARIELELTKVQERLEFYHSQADEIGADRTNILPRLEGYVVRFLLLYLSFQTWNLIEGLLSRVFFVGFGSFLYDRLFSLFFTLGDLLIFAVLGLPLLRDIIATSGYRLRNPLRKKAVDQTP